MLFLTGSILLSAWLNIVFKLCKHFGIDTFQTIVYNYAFCVLTGLLLMPTTNEQITALSIDLWPWALTLGLGFILTFNLTALTVKRNGVATATVATKVSLLIPFMAAFILYGDQLNALKFTGIILTLVAVILTFMPNSEQGVQSNPGSIWLPLSIFIGSGLLDTVIKYVEHHHLTEQSTGVFLILCFGVAFVVGVVLLIVAFITRKVIFQPKALLAGIILGVPNFFSIWCLIRLLKVYPSQSSVWIPVNNVAIVLVNVLIALWVFKEPLSRINKMGIGIALISIILLSATST